MKITFLNQSGDGFGKELEIDEGTRLDDFLVEQFSENFNPSSMKIRVNGSIATRTQILEDGDYVDAVPVNQKGA